MQIGLAGHIVLTAQNSGVTTANTTEIAGAVVGAPIAALSENLTLTYDRFETVNIHGGLHEPDDEAGVKRIAGDIAAAAHPETVGFFLAGALQRSSTASMGTAFFRNTFTTPTSDNYSDAAVQPYTAEIYRPNAGAGTTAFRYWGLSMTTLGISFAPNQDVRLSASFIGYAVDTITKTTPTFSNSPTGPYKFNTASIEIGGVGDSTIEALNVTVDNQLEGVATLRSSDRILRVVRRGPQQIRVSGTMQFADFTHYNRFLNQTEFQVKATVTKADSFQMILDLPRVVLNGAPVVMQGRERILVNWEGMARYHTGSGTTIEAQITSVRSAYTH